MTSKLSVRTAVVAALMASGTAMATPMTVPVQQGWSTDAPLSALTGTSNYSVDGAGGTLSDTKFHRTDPSRPTSAPEPATLGLLAFGLAGLAVARRRRARWAS